MIIAGLDVGLTGAVAFLDTTTGAVRAVDMPVLILQRGGKTKRDIDSHQLVEILSSAPVGHAFLEDVHSRPGQGVSGVFAFGLAKGVVIGVLTTLSVPWTAVPPPKWKRVLSVPAAKDGARARASQLLPNAAHQWPRVKDHGRAEAALIALYGARSLAALALDAAEGPARAAASGRAPPAAAVSRAAAGRVPIPSVFIDDIGERNTSDG